MKQVKRAPLLLVAILTFLAANSQAQDWVEIAKGLPTPYEQQFQNLRYGNSVAIDGNYAVIGTKGYENNKGTAFVLFHDGTNWTSIAQLLPTDGITGGFFGSAVSISGNHIVIGCFGDSTYGINSGAAYVFTKPTNGWTDTTQTAKILASDGATNFRFGNAASIHGDNIVIGCSGDNTNGYNSGSAYVFTKPASGWKDTIQTAKLLHLNGDVNDFFGNSVSIYGDNIVVGSQNDDDNGSNSGSALVFTKPVTGWKDTTETAQLFPSDGADSDLFGRSVSISGDNIVVGAQSNDDNGSNSGSAYVFTKTGLNWTNMTQTAKLLPSDGATDDIFGSAVCISGNNIIVSAIKNENGTNEGAAYVYTKPGANWVNMTQTAKLIGQGGTTLFGGAISISNDKIIVGSQSIYIESYQSGAAYSFTKPGSSWVNTTPDERILSPLVINSNIQNYYGSAVDIDGNFAIVGSNNYKNQEGMAYVLFFDGNNWITQAKLTASDANSNDYFGISVAISGDNIVIGSYNEEAYVFTKPLSGWTDTTETAILTSPDAPGWNSFGSRVDISDDYIIIGSPTVDIGGTSNAGAGYVFTKPLSGWVNSSTAARLTAGPRRIGYSVSIDSNTIVIGANISYYGSRHACVYIKPVSGWQDATPDATLTSSDNQASFGIPVSISGDNIVVGAKEDATNGSYAGSIYVFEKPGTGWANMTQTTKLFPSDASTNDRFGTAVNIDSNRIIAGKNGAAYIFEEPTTGWAPITESKKIVSSDTLNSTNFGSAVGLFKNYAIIGDLGYSKPNETNIGSAHLFRYCTHTAFTLTTSACISYTSPSGKTYSSSNTYLDTILNATGCDSVITINLTIKNPVNNSVTNSVCYNSSYTYADSTVANNIITNQSHISTLIAANGCDSIHTENLTVLSQLTGTYNETVCFGDSIVVNGNTYDANNLTGTEVFSNIGTNNCDSTVTVTLTIEPMIDTSVTTAGITITANQTGAAYRWLDCSNNSIIPGETGITYIASINGYYASEITVGNCTDTSRCVNISTVGIDKNRAFENLSVYPNPNQGIVNVDLGKLKDVAVKVFNTDGKIIYSKENINTSLLQFELNTSAGIYFVEVTSKSQTQKHKLVIE